MRPVALSLIVVLAVGALTACGGKDGDRPGGATPFDQPAGGQLSKEEYQHRVNTVLGQAPPFDELTATVSAARRAGAGRVDEAAVERALMALEQAESLIINQTSEIAMIPAPEEVADLHAQLSEAFGRLSHGYERARSELATAAERGEAGAASRGVDAYLEAAGAFRREIGAVSRGYARKGYAELGGEP